MTPVNPIALGMDFGTESVRVVLVDLKGNELATVVERYRHGQIIETLPRSSRRLPPHFALQNPQDWIDSATKAVRRSTRQARLRGDEVIGIGVAFTSCTMLPTLRDGRPLCLLAKFRDEPLAWPKLWKHHGAQTQAARINAVAQRRKEKFLRRYGGIIGLEWFFPKVLETLENAPATYKATEVWLEGGDWLVWQLVGGNEKNLTRSTCQAGYKGMWSAEEGFPSRDFFRAVHPKLAEVVRDKMPGRMLSPGESAGNLSDTMAKRLGLKAGIPVSAAVIDAHAGVPGSGAAEPGTLVMVLGTSSCHMLNAVEERFVSGVAGVVKGGILPGYFGYETGQAAVGDAFDWLRRLAGQRDFKQLSLQAANLSPGAEGILCLDWFNGCRTPLMDGSLTGAFTGLSLGHSAAHLYRAMLEASAFGLRWIVELLREHGVPVKQFVATGGLPHHNPLVVQIYSDVLGEIISVSKSHHASALGAAILGALAAGRKVSGFKTAAAAIRAMAPSDQARKVQPDLSHKITYDRLYRKYRKLAEQFSSRSDH